MTKTSQIQRVIGIYDGNMGPGVVFETGSSGMCKDGFNIEQKADVWKLKEEIKKLLQWTLKNGQSWEKC